MPSLFMIVKLQGDNMKRTEIGIGNMRIDVVDDNVVYINLNGWTYYIDDSTDEKILKKWKEIK